ncbi:hypothetical protein Q426_05285 [Streptococcus equi subsp. zooepidemicus CY]|nr:hypothetical protein Q426_05285 [Streptococcus equi subsp. zooepidemicus CY]
MSPYQSFQAYDTVIILLTAPNTNDKAFTRHLIGFCKELKAKKINLKTDVSFHEISF